MCLPGIQNIAVVACKEPIKKDKLYFYSVLGDLHLRRKASISEVIYKCYEIALDCDEEELKQTFLDFDIAQVTTGMCCMGAVQDRATPSPSLESEASEESSGLSDEELTQIAHRLRTIGDDLERSFQEMTPHNSFLRDISPSCNLRQLFRSAFLVVRLFANRFTWSLWR